MSKIIHIFFETSMSNGHKGLASIAAKHLAKTRFQEGFVVFINKKWTALKAFTVDSEGLGLVAHLKRPDNLPINPETIKLIPKYFNGSNFNYEGALREVILKKFKSRLL
jgi:hypothetical protein